MAEIIIGNEIKMIAFYLPQFHTIPENDRAWGKGFTEWTNTKKAKPLFDGHYQPKTPLNHNFYNLLNSNIQIWQAELAKKYNVWGFCYYHYWFKNGKKLLEKPAENMLYNKKINIPFCFCWANENWSKLWDGGNKQLIVEQEYGNENEWELHFQYLLNFFKDERYITLNGNPVFIIYKPELIPNVSKMISFFKRRCSENGFKDLIIMFQSPTYLFSKSYDETLYDYFIDYEPGMTREIINRKGNRSKNFKESIKHFIGPKLSHKLTKYIGKLNHDSTKVKQPNLIDYDEVWKEILKREYLNERFIPGCFPAWDNTARKVNGTVFIGASPEKFAFYLKKLVKKTQELKCPNMIFINAWNEWGEGAYLEPDEKYQYGYLEAIRRSIYKG